MSDLGGHKLEEITLGSPDKKFTMDQVPLDISFVECSVKQGDLHQLDAWIKEHI